VTFSISPQDAVAQEGCSLVVGGAGVAFVGAMIFDIGTASSSARSYNARRVDAAPIIDPVNRTFGLAIKVSFGTAPIPTYRRVPPAGGSDGPKSEAVASLWSLGATIVPVGIGLSLHDDHNDAILPVSLGLISAGIFLGPGAGHWYADNKGRAMMGVAARVGIFGIGVLLAASCY